MNKLISLLSDSRLRQPDVDVDVTATFMLLVAGLCYMIHFDWS